MSKRKIIIDTDPGIDDAVAIAAAIHSDALSVELITTVAGNVGLNAVTDNVLKLLKFWDKKIPVAKGAEKPLLKKLDDASNVHGKSGMEGYEFPDGDYNNLLQIPATQAIYDVLVKSDDKVTIVAIGPLTNIALLLSVYPDAKNHIDEIVMMGGSATRGNKGVMAEFNVYTDPEAAKIVFDSGIPIVMAGLDVGWKALVYKEDSQKIKQLNKTGDMIYALFQKYRGGSLKTGLKMYDACAIAYLLKPEMYEIVETTVDIETKGELTSGTTVVDLKGYLKREHNAKVCLDIDGKMFREWLTHAIKACS